MIHRYGRVGGDSMRRQPGFFDVDDRLKRLTDRGDQLEAIQATVDFETFRLRRRHDCEWSTDWAIRAAGIAQMSQNATGSSRCPPSCGRDRANWLWRRVSRRALWQAQGHECLYRQGRRKIWSHRGCLWRPIRG